MTTDAAAVCCLLSAAAPSSFSLSQLPPLIRLLSLSVAFCRLRLRLYSFASIHPLVPSSDMSSSHVDLASSRGPISILGQGRGRYVQNQTTAPTMCQSRAQTV